MKDEQSRFTSGIGGTDIEPISDERGITRREFLRDSALVAAGVAGVDALANRLTLPGHTVWAASAPRSAKDTIVLGWEAEMGTLDPLKTISAHENRYNVQVFETLLRLEGSSRELRPSLATNWKSSADGKVWTFTIRQGVRFHDGNRLRAQDVKWAYDRYLNPKHPFYQPPYGLLDYLYSSWQGVEVVDDRTIRVSLKRLDPMFISSLIWPYLGIVSPEAVKKLGNRGFAVKPVGTGPWRVVEWTKGTRLILERNANYWRTPPILRRIIIKPILEDAVRLGQLKTGEVDVIVAVPPQFISDIENDPNLQLLRTVSNHIWYIALNVKEKPLDDKRVRQALNYAVNREAIVRQLLKGGAQLMRGPIVVGSWAEDTSLSPYPYDPQKAKQLLAAAGYPDGFKTRFWVPESGSGMLAPKEIATLVQAQLKEVGVMVELVTQEWTSYVAEFVADGLAGSKGKPSYGMGEMSSNLPTDDPLAIIDLSVKTDAVPPKGFNPGFYSNPEVDRILTEAASTMDRVKRKQLYFQAQKIMYDDPPWIFMFSAENLVAARKNVKGLEVNPTPWWLEFTRVYVEG